MAKIIESLFSNVAYRATVYKTGVPTSIPYKVEDTWQIDKKTNILSVSNWFVQAWSAKISQIWLEELNNIRSFRCETLKKRVVNKEKIFLQL